MQHRVLRGKYGNPNLKDNLCSGFKSNIVYANKTQDFAELIFDMRVDLAVERGNATGVASAVTEEDLAEIVQLIARQERAELAEEKEEPRGKRGQTPQEATGKDQQLRDEL